MKKTFAQLKRDLKIGTKLQCIFNSYGKYFNEVREISVVHSNAIALKTYAITSEDRLIERRTGVEAKPKYFDSWLYYPIKSSMVEYEDDTFSFYDYNVNDELVKILTYKIVG